MSAPMTPRTFETPCGTIRYWVSPRTNRAANLIFLPGLTADHRLFDRQLDHFAGTTPCLVWDPPSHGASRPFAASWSLDDAARWLHEIIEREGFDAPVLIGQSMGGYLAQAYLERYPKEVSGFIAIDSSPLRRSYFSGWEIALLKHTRPLYASIPWRLLIRWGSHGCATSEYGRALMRTMMECYEKHDYVDLAAHGYRVVAEAIEANLPYDIGCPALILCGTKDAAGSAKRYSQAWSERTGIPLIWIEGAGHNSNTDNPDAVNSIIAGFTATLRQKGCRASESSR